MKTNTYRVSERNLVQDDAVVIGLKFDGDETIYEGPLEQLPQIVRENGLRHRMPRRVTINGRKGGAFPCLIARSELAAAFISGVVGYTITKDDGVSFATQAKAAETFSKARAVGAEPEEMSFEWRIGQQVEAQAELPFQNGRKLNDLAEEESPFA